MCGCAFLRNAWEHGRYWRSCSCFFSSLRSSLPSILSTFCLWSSSSRISSRERRYSAYQYPSSFVCFCFQHTGSCLALQGCRTAKKQGRLTSQQAAPHGINTPLFYGGKPGKDTACRLPYPLLIPVYILHVRGVNAPCFICSEKCYPRGMAT